MLQAVLSQVHPDWYVEAGDTLAPELVERARVSAYGQRLLLRCLLDAGAGAALLAPRPGKEGPTTAGRWPREKLCGLIRDLGVLAYAPVIRAEIRREPVRWLRQVLGNSYLLALDPTVWNARVQPEVQSRLSADWEQLLRNHGTDDAALHAMLDRQGRNELHSWATQRDPELADWVMLMHTPGDPGPAHLPEKPVLLVCTHHETRRPS